MNPTLVKDSPPGRPTALAVTRGRLRIYAWLANYYLFEPNDELLRITDPKITKPLTLIFGSRASKEALTTILQINESSIQEMRDEFHSLFLIPIRGRYVPPYESCFRERIGDRYGNLWGKVTEDVQKFYREAGFNITLPSNIYAPDHIGLELAFLSKLCEVELSYLTICNIEEARKKRDVQRAFLKDHLSTWVNDFSKDVVRSSSSNFYKNIAKLTADFVHLDLELISNSNSLTYMLVD